MADAQAEFELKVGPHDIGELRVVSFELDEEMSAPYTLEVTASVAAGVAVDPPSLVGETGALVIHLGEAGDRWIHGVVAQVRTWDEHREDGGRLLRFQLVPRLWTLGLGRNSRVFQEKSIPDIVKEVLDAGGVEHRENLSASYSPRDYVVQYGESDLDFVRRLLEDAGIFFFFEHEEDKETMVLADSNRACTAIPGNSPTILFMEGSRTVEGTDSFDSFAASVGMCTGALTLRDFNYLTPATDLTAKATADADASLEVYEYPAGYAWHQDGQRLARIRLEEARARAELCTGAGLTRRLVPGFRFELDDHPLPELNDEYLVLEVSHRGSQEEILTPDRPVEDQLGGYRCQVRCIRASVPFRPRRVTPRPMIPGPQTAIVVGPSGEEIHTDPHGRVKVQFHWDRLGKKNERSSCWIRVSQAWAGAGWGALYLPRIGHEVVVEFLEADPDRPIITGSVYNGLNPPPIALPDEKTRSTLRSDSSPTCHGSNELRFEDQKGAEEVYLHAQKDLSIIVENDKEQYVHGNESLTVDGDRSRTIGGSQTLEVAKNDSSSVGANQELVVAGNRSTQVGGNHTETVGGDQSVTVGGVQTVTVALAAAETIGAAKALTVGGAYAVTVGAAMNEMVAGLRSEEVGGAKIELVGAKRAETVAGSRMANIGGDLTESVGGMKTLKVGKDYAVQVAGNMRQTVKDAYVLKAKEITLAATDKLVMKIGSATLTFKSSGEVVINGSKVQVKTSGAIALKGSPVSEN